MANNIGAIPVGKCIWLGYGTSFNVQSICAQNGLDYTKLNTNNFIVGAYSVPWTQSPQSNQIVSGWANAIATGFTISHSYNPGNGTLSIGGYGQTIYTNDWGNSALKGGTGQYATCFAYLVYVG